jgi:hypothetical protein
MKNVLLVVGIMLLLVSCKKIEGEGGRASVTGKILVHERLWVNGTCTDTVTYAGVDHDVFIIYGEENTMYNDKIKSSYDGSFKFSYLQPGTYTVFAYSKILHLGNNIPNNDDDYNTLEAVKISFTIKSKEQKDLGTIEVIKN